MRSFFFGWIFLIGFPGLIFAQSSLNKAEQDSLFLTQMEFDSLVDQYVLYPRTKDTLKTEECIQIIRLFNSKGIFDLKDPIHQEFYYRFKYDFSTDCFIRLDFLQMGSGYFDYSRDLALGGQLNPNSQFFLKSRKE